LLREEIVSLHLEGLTNYRIAKTLGIDHSTVRYHLKVWLED
jgi:hypothetical protein